MSMTEQEYLDQARRIADSVEEAEKELAETQDLLDDLRGKQVALQEAWKEKRRKVAELPYGQGDIVHFGKATLGINRTRDYVVTEVTVDKLCVETEGMPSSYTHEEAEKLDVTVFKKATS